MAMVARFEMTQFCIHQLKFCFGFCSTPIHVCSHCGMILLIACVGLKHSKLLAKGFLIFLDGVHGTLFGQAL